MQCLGLAIRFEAGANFHQTRWSVKIVLRVFLAAPQQLDGFAGQGLGNGNRLTGKVLRAFTSQATTHLHGKHFDIFLRHIGCACCCRQAGLGVLGRDPNLQLIVLQPSCADHGL